MMTVAAIPGFSDPFSSILHLLGAFIFLLLGIRWMYFPFDHRGWHVAVGVFVFSVVFLLTMSGVFHLLEHESPGRDVLQRLDHAGIFALIAGTFTPIHTILFRGIWRWGVLVPVWVLAITGMTLKSIFFHEMAEWLGLIFYLGLGWIGILSAYLTHRLHGFTIVRPLIYGALAYTIGATLEYLRLPILIPQVIGPHELFHIAVLAGIGWHWQFVRKLVLLKNTKRSVA